MDSRLGKPGSLAGPRPRTGHAPLEPEPNARPGCGERRPTPPAAARRPAGHGLAAGPRSRQAADVLPAAAAEHRPALPVSVSELLPQRRLGRIPQPRRRRAVMPSTTSRATSSRPRVIPSASPSSACGGYPSRSEQLAAQQVGISRYNSIQRHIDRMAMPRFGYGFGVGGSSAGSGETARPQSVRQGSPVTVRASPTSWLRVP